MNPEDPGTLSARCSTVETEVIAEVPLATPTMHAVQELWTGRARGVGFVRDTLVSSSLFKKYRVFLGFMYLTLVQQGPGVEPGDCLSNTRSPLL